ncbi:Cytochrome c oxidase subunit 7A [Oleoguttula sp. CCFEE 5521]
MVKPITSMLRRGLVLDLSVAFGTSAHDPSKEQQLPPAPSEDYPDYVLEQQADISGGTVRFHMPAVRKRDTFYAKLEDQRAEALGQV